MSGSFVEKIRKNKIKSPTKAGFKVTQWDKVWEEEGTKDAKDKDIYESGRIIFGMLEEIRTELKELYSKAPGVDDEKLLRIYFALSNRDRAIVSKDTLEIDEKVKNIFSATSNSNFMSNEITFQEIADGCVDAFEKAIFFSKKRINDNSKIEKSSAPLELIEYIAKEANLSQLYDACESYWNALLWGGWGLSEIDKANNIYCIYQEKNYLEVGGIVSETRKSRLSAQNAIISSDDSISKFFNEDRYISIKKGKGREKKVRSFDILTASNAVRYFNTAWRTSELILSDEFPSEILENEFDNGFSINDALSVLRCLMLLSHQCTDQYPEDSGFNNVNKLMSFCPKVKKIELIKGLVNATRMDFKKVSEILNFLEFKSGKNEDLWSHPIILLRNNEYILLTSSLLTPSITRVVEHWLVKLDIDMQDKGLTYEQTVLDSLNKAVSSNPFIKDFDKGVSKRIKLPCGEEEIDFLMRIGSVIFIGEVKSIVTTDSPISKYRTIEILKKASAQVKRKSKYVKDNLNLVFDYLGWEFNEEISYTLVGCIVNSGRMYAGFCIDDVPVCDEKILTKYFDSGIVPFISTFEEGGTKPQHLAWFKLYENFEELQSKIDAYLRTPPQIDSDMQNFEHKKIRLPCINDSSYKIIIDRLVHKNITAQNMLKKDHAFSIETAANIDKELEKMHFII